MADKSKPGLPPPPGQQSTFANMLSGVKSYFGLGDQADVEPWDLYMKPVAGSRITRTPIYQHSGVGWPEDQLAEYDPFFNHMTVRESTLQDNPGEAIPHESSHVLYRKSGLSPDSVPWESLPYSARMAVADPSAYPALPGQATPEQIEANKRMRANEGLAFSIGNPNATPLIEHVASQIQDPNIAQQLRRLHYNAINARKSRLDSMGR